MSSSAEPKCPVDEKTRARWISQQTLAAPVNAPPAHPLKPKPATKNAAAEGPATLAKEREISTIPRVPEVGPSNAEHTSATSPDSKNWIYPSEEMFFNAMRRKSHDPNVADMRQVVPIHNAVNERAWKEIKEWEAMRGGSETCGGPRLASFSGDVKKMTPKARIMTLMGYEAPFDRHDWTVDRCGKKVEYVIDFYAGKKDPLVPNKLSFYLDVRPKLGVEGCIMRAQRWWQKG